MKIVEGLKGLRVLQKRIEDNAAEITKYSSVLSTEKPAFGTEDEQRKQVKQRIQANEDLAIEYLKLKARIEYTNLVTMIELSGKKYSLNDLLVIKRTLGKLMQNTYTALTQNTAQLRLSRVGVSAIDGKPIEALMMYNEVDKINGIRKWQELSDKIDSRLEVLNASLDLIEFTPEQIVNNVSTT